MKRSLSWLALVAVAIAAGLILFRREVTQPQLPTVPSIASESRPSLPAEAPRVGHSEPIATKPFIEPEELRLTLITGRCIGDAAPLPGTEIQLVTLPRMDASGNPGIISYGKTNASADGTFVVGPIKLEDNKQEDVFSLIFRHRSADSSELRLHVEPQVAVTVDKTTALGDIVIGRPSETTTLLGKLETDQGEPLARVDVRVYYRANIPPHTLVTNEHGRFKVVGLTIPGATRQMFMVQVQPMSAQSSVAKFCAKTNRPPSIIAAIIARDDQFNVPNEHNFEGWPGFVEHAMFVASLREPPTFSDGIEISSSPELEGSTWRLLGSNLQVITQGTEPLSKEISRFVYRRELEELRNAMPIVIEFEHSDGERFVRLPVTISNDSGNAMLRCATDTTIPWQRGSTVTGIAVNASGSPVPNAELVLDFSASDNSALSYRATRSKADGSFELRNVPPGTFRRVLLGPESRNRWIIEDQPVTMVAIPREGIQLGQVPVY